MAGYVIKRQGRSTPRGRGRRPLRRSREDRESERGAVLVLFAIAITCLLGVVALVLDVGFGYAVGRQDQTVADMSALAGAPYLPGDPQGACGAAWDYVTANLPGLPAGAASPCGGFPASCASDSTAADYTATLTGSYTITFRYPVPNGAQDGLSSTDVDSLMAAGPDPRTQDGTDQCARLGVAITHLDAAFFAPVGGLGPLSPRVDAVARESAGTKLTKVANLVSLDPFGCGPSIGVNGNNTKVIVGTATLSGAIAVDSNGSGCTGAQVSVSAGATGSELYACPNAASADPLCPTSGAQGQGQILLHDLSGNATSCSPPACSSSDVTNGRLGPQPITDPERVTRSVVDHAFNCHTSYPLFDGSIPVQGCYNGISPYVDSLITQVQSYNDSTNPPTLPATYSLVNGAACSPTGSVTYPPGNYWIDCNKFKIGGGGGSTAVTFQGNVIIDGNVELDGGGSLTFQGNPTGSMVNCETTVCLGASDPKAAFVYLGGSLSTTSSNYALTLNDTFMYETSAGGNGTLANDPRNYGCAVQSNANSVQTQSGGTENWVAPYDGPFNSLALWGESGTGSNGAVGNTGTSFQMTGGGGTTVNGVFFTPCALFKISGGFSSFQTAQFLAFQLAVSGGSVLQMNPDPNRLIKDSPSGSELIR